MKELWVEKYRPDTIAEYVFRDDAQKKQVQSWVDTGAIPHLLFSGIQGSGKTTMGKVLLNELNINKGDVLWINASSDNGVDFIRDTIVNFTSSMPWGEYKVVFLDEADYLSPNAQAALRGTMERFSNTARFILTCNYPHKIIPAIHSRCQGFHIEKLDMNEFTARIAQILIKEDVKFELDTVDTYVSAAYPDMRKCINLCQQNAQTGVLEMPQESEGSESDYKLEMIALFKQRKYKEGRELICSQVSQEEYDGLYTFMYQNLDLWADTDDKANECILAIRNGLVKHVSAGDPEINLSATLTELMLIADS